MGGQLLGLVITLLVISILIYASLYVAPGGGPIGALTGGHPITPAEIRQLDAEYHLNDSFFVQYFHWLLNAVRGNFGESLVYHQSVARLIGPRLVTTMSLVAYASVLIIVGGISLGVLASLYPRRLGVVIVATTSLGLAIPAFVASVLLIAIFAVQLGWFPVFGAGTGVADRVWHLTLPAIALAISNIAYIAQITAAEMRGQFGREHVETARVRGIPKRLLVRRHVLRNALIPVTTSVGLTVAALFAVDAVVEDAFGINGVGAYLVQAIEDKDFAVVQAIALVMVTIFVLVNALVDVLYAILDPRLAQEASA